MSSTKLDNEKLGTCRGLLRACAKVYPIEKVSPRADLSLLICLFLILRYFDLLLFCWGIILFTRSLDTVNFSNENAKRRTKISAYLPLLCHIWEGVLPDASSLLRSSCNQALFCHESDGQGVSEKFCK